MGAVEDLGRLEQERKALEELAREQQEKIVLVILFPLLSSHAKW